MAGATITVSLTGDDLSARFARLASLLRADPIAVMEGDHAAQVMLLRGGSGILRTVVKATRDRHKLYLQSYKA